MKTSDSIERQGERKNNGDTGGSPRANTRPAREKLPPRDPSRIAAWRWQPGHSGNPSGRPKHDLAAELAKAIFEENWPALYRAYLKAALKGNGYVFETLANRAFGKLKESVTVDVNPYREMTDEQLRERVRELEEKLGYTRALPAASEDEKVN